MQPLHKNSLFSQLSFFLVLASVILISVLFLANLIMWRNAPNFGFGFRNATGIKVVGVVRTHGEMAGLRVGDHILAVNGKTYDTYPEFNTAKNWKLGEINTYLIERDGRKIEIAVENIPLGLKKSVNESGMPFLMGMCYAFIGVLVFLMKPHRRASWAFFLFTVTLGLMLTFLFKVGVLRPFWLENFILFAYCFLPPTMIHLAFTFPEERSLLKKSLPLRFLPYIFSVLLFLSIRSATTTIMSAPRSSLVALVAYIAFGVLFFLGSNIQLRLMSKSEIVIRRSKMILLGFAISASIPLLDFGSNTLFRVYLVPGFNYYLPFFIVFPAFVGYSIVKHDLFDIDAIIKRTYGYVLTTGAVAGVYGLFVLVSNLAFGGFEFTQSPLFPLIFILGVVFFFNPIRNRVQKVVDRVFYRLEYDYRETVEKISETMRSLIGLDETVRAILNTAQGTMFIESGCVLLQSRDKKEYVSVVRFREPDSRIGFEAKRNQVTDEKENTYSVEVKESVVGEGGSERVRPEERNNGKLVCDTPELKVSAEDPLIRKLAEMKKELTIYDIQEDPFFEADRDLCYTTFEALGGSLIVPLIYEDRLTGVISLGRKKSGKFYRREDINLLKTLANQGAVAIENALMIEDVIEKERMEEELNIARDLQMSMLPASCPQVEGFEIAALSEPAREVGGDFFDFIEMGEGKLGLIVGDVTGKSVSGALVMSAARSVFRMLSEEGLNVEEIMIRANRRAKKDMKSGMFVALLYALLDSKERSVSLCSAGQTQPIHFSASAGKPSLVQTEGDTFPIGILDEVEYKDTQLHLAPGDRLVFYTDGIVEAMNSESQIFGFERLLELIKSACSMNADDLLKEIMTKVNEFVGGAPQSDDLTVIVISVR
jgi:serine phosphatase RsbU (regulator of sigma subunit)